MFAPNSHYLDDMKRLIPSKVSNYLLLKLPAAYLCGVRLRSIDQHRAEVGVRFRWINQNPFKSMFWAVQGMAAELAGGMLVMQSLRAQDASISMLLVGTQGEFTKKARGKILFTCQDGAIVESGVAQCLKTGAGVQFELTTEGRDEDGDLVCRFRFHWSVKVR